MPTAAPRITHYARLIHALLLVFALAALGGCAGLPPGHDYARTESSALATPEQTKLGKQFGDAAQAHAGNSAYRMVPLGLDGFFLRAQMIEVAERTLDVQYYIFRNDETGKLLCEAMLRAADRGVRVRIMVDDIDIVGDDAQIQILDAHPNIEVRVYNPLRYRGKVKALRYAEIVFNLPRLDYRMHNKLMVIDNAIALVGGRNVGDEYFQVDPEGQLGDYETFAGGPIVRDLSKVFDQFWANLYAVPVGALAAKPPSQEDLGNYRQELREHRQEKREDGSDYATRVSLGEPLRGMLGGRVPLVWAPALVVYDPPDKRAIVRGEKRARLLRDSLYEEADKVESEFLMISAYLVPGRDGMELFRKLNGRGVTQRVVTNSLESNSEPTAHAGYLHFRHAILAQNVTLHETRALPGSTRGAGQSAGMNSYGNFGIHTKLMVFDRRRILVSSMNYDQRSLNLNTELGLIIDSPELAQQGIALFNGLAQPLNSYRVTLEVLPGPEAPRLTWRTVEKNGTPVLHTEEPAKSAGQRLEVQLLSLLPLDHEL
jgi:putative cardiolipin synthase